MKHDYFKTWLQQPETQLLIQELYPNPQKALREYKSLVETFTSYFPHHQQFDLFSSSGRVELCGNHTDHQGGLVLACTIHRDTRACASVNMDHVIRLHSQGYEMITIDLNDLSMKNHERFTTQGLLRGLAFYFSSVAPLNGVDIVMTSDVLSGSGLSSSAAFECCILSIFNTLCNQQLSAPHDLAKLAQQAENDYFGKPSGLLDQWSVMHGGVNMMNFKYPSPLTRTLHLNEVLSEYDVCVVHTQGSHDDLSAAYASIVDDNATCAHHFEKARLIDLEESTFYEALPHLMNEMDSRVLLRSIHFFEENKRVISCSEAIEQGNIQKLIENINASGHSSFEYLNNVLHPSSQYQGLALGLAMAQTVLKNEGACRVHGGGFAGTILCITPKHRTSHLKHVMMSMFGEKCFDLLKIREHGTICLSKQ